MNDAAMTSFVPEIEQELLGALLLDNSARRVLPMLRDYHFIHSEHQEIFRAIATSIERFNSANPAVVNKLVADDVRQKFMVDKGISIAQYLASIAANCVFGGNGAQKHAQKVVEQWARYQIKIEAEELAAACKDPRTDIQQAAKFIRQRIDDITSDIRGGASKKTRQTLASASVAAIEAAEAAMRAGTGITGVPWGLSDVDRLTGGMQRRDLTLIAARPSMGKTTIGMSVGLKAAQKGHGVAFISLEMDSEKLSARALSDTAYDQNASIPYADLIKGNIGPSQIEAIKAARQDLEGIPLWIEDQSGLSMSEIRVKIEAIMAEADSAGTPINVVIIDHLGLIKPSSRYSGNRTNEIAEVTAGLKALAREMNIAIILLSQLNRAVESRDNKRPMLSDLRDSGAIEQDADTIVFLYREAYYLEREEGGSQEKQAERTERLIDCRNKLEFNIAKQRNGPVTTVDLFIDIAFSAVRSAAGR